MYSNEIEFINGFHTLQKSLKLSLKFCNTVFIRLPKIPILLPPNQILWCCPYNRAPQLQRIIWLLSISIKLQLDLKQTSPQKTLLEKYLMCWIYCNQVNRDLYSQNYVGTRKVVFHRFVLYFYIQYGQSKQNVNMDWIDCDIVSYTIH